MKSFKYAYLICALVLCALALCALLGCDEGSKLANGILTSEHTEVPQWHRAPHRDIVLQVPDEVNTWSVYYYQGHPFDRHGQTHNVRFDAKEYNDIIYLPDGTGQNLYAFNMSGDFMEAESLQREYIKQVVGELNYHDNMTNEDHDGFLIDNLLFRATVVSPARGFSINGHAIWDLDTKEYIGFEHDAFSAISGDWTRYTGWTQYARFTMDGLLYMMWKPDSYKVGHFAHPTPKHLTISAFEFVGSSFQPIPEKNITLQLPDDYHDLYMNTGAGRSIGFGPTHNFVADGRIYLFIGRHFLVFDTSGNYLDEVQFIADDYPRHFLDTQFYHERTKTLYFFGGRIKDWVDDKTYRCVFNLIAYQQN